MFRGTPILLQMFIIYHGLAGVELVRESMFRPIFREPYDCASVALMLNAGAYVSEIFRGGVLGVDRGPLGAATALGLSVRQRFVTS